VDAEGFAGPLKDVERAIKYFPKAVNLTVDWITFLKIHRLQFYPQGRFSHLIELSDRGMIKPGYSLESIGWPPSSLKRENVRYHLVKRVLDQVATGRP
jgi:hypothetical protein